MGFTQAARLRLLKFIARVNWDRLNTGIFVTLTYPDAFLGRDKRQRNQDRHQFLRAMESYYGKPLTGIWRIEWKPRLSGKLKGEIMPHFHLLLLGPRYIPWQYVRDKWKQIIGWSGLIATDVTSMKSGEMASVYIAKYMSKVPPDCSLDNRVHLNNQGRHYGFIRKGLMPLCPVITTSGLSDEEIAGLLLEGRKRLPWVDLTAAHTFSFLGKNTSEVWEKLLILTLDRTHPIRENA